MTRATFARQVAKIAGAISKGVLVAVLSCNTICSVSAQQTLTGAIGLPLNPTAQLPPSDEIPVQANFYELGPDFTWYGLFAAMRLSDRLEISGGVNRLDNHDDQEGISLGVKYLLTDSIEKPNALHAAAGAGYNNALGTNAYAYLVASKAVGSLRGRRLCMAHLGARYDHFEDVAGEIGIGQGSSDRASAYLGLEVPLTRRGNFTLAGELQTKNHNFQAPAARAPYSAAIYYRPSGKRFKVGLGVQREGLTGNNGLMFVISTTTNRR